MTHIHSTWTNAPHCPVRPLSHRERLLRDAVSEWVTTRFNRRGRLLFALSLTCKQAVMGPAGRLIWLDKELLSSQLRTFFKRIDWKVYKNASKRNGKHVERFCVIEGGKGTGKRTHVHALVCAPPSVHMHPTAFIRNLKSQWASSEWGMPDAFFDLPESPLAAVRYLTKTGLDAIDWSNTEV